MAWKSREYSVKAYSPQLKQKTRRVTERVKKTKFLHVHDYQVGNLKVELSACVTVDSNPYNQNEFHVN